MEERNGNDQEKLPYGMRHRQSQGADPDISTKILNETPSRILMHSVQRGCKASLRLQRNRNGYGFHLRTPARASELDILEKRTINLPSKSNASDAGA
ncbi:hypothetical protein Ddye_018535 [Dipteronia dyeriana]|uniref:Uncharacterized protein n=1 Tax=Dipteronia dyeriana TaxID=168575 RepID=A0AAD9X1I7_9ROSI|nr:hypothetical protein Ddye_018535 [Dipteronia dyeriana]